MHSISMKYWENNAHLYVTANIVVYGLFTVFFVTFSHCLCVVSQIIHTFVELQDSVLV